jgi:hypothetical protein
VSAAYPESATGPRSGKSRVVSLERRPPGFAWPDALSGERIGMSFTVLSGYQVQPSASARKEASRAAVTRR